MRRALLPHRQLMDSGIRLIAGDLMWLLTWTTTMMLLLLNVLQAFDHGRHLLPLYVRLVLSTDRLPFVRLSVCLSVRPSVGSSESLDFRRQQAKSLN